MADGNSESCDVIEADLEPGRNIVIVPTPNQERLTEKQLVDYRSYRESFLNWLLHIGKTPKRAEGYSPYTVYESGYRSAAFDRWVWDQHGYRLPPSHDDADLYLEEVAYSDRAQATKGKIEEMLLRYFRWLSRNHDESEWEPVFSFESAGGGSPRDFLTKEERRQIRQTVMDEDDWKIISIVWTSLDAGLRPIEVGRATTRWVDIDNDVLRIPMEESSKNEHNWVVSLTDRTSTALERWMDKRTSIDRYEGTDSLWLTTHNNPYASKSLGRLIRRLCGQAGIPTENRQMSWYAIRHSVGTYMTEERDLAASKSQLRHKSVQTTMKYDQAPVEDRRDALNRMG